MSEGHRSWTLEREKAQKSSQVITVEKFLLRVLSCSESVGAQVRHNKFCKRPDHMALSAYFPRGSLETKGTLLASLAALLGHHDGLGAHLEDLLVGWRGQRCRC